MEYKRRIVINLIFAGIFLFLVTGCINEYSNNDNLNQLKKYNVTWDSPGENSLGSMPLGNGDIKRERVKEIFNAHLKSDEDHTECLFLLLTFGIWFRKFGTY